MEGSATNEVKQGKKKSKERESPCEKEKEISIPFDAEKEKEILSDLLREGNTEMENIEVRQQERKSKDKEKETPPGFVGQRTTKTEAHANVEVIRESEEREIEALPNAEREKNNPLDFIGERETEMEALADNEVRGSKKKGKERENHCERRKDSPPSERGKEKETPPDAEVEKDAPPNDDICPICFENYNIPCKTNCGHWYCENAAAIASSTNRYSRGLLDPDKLILNFAIARIVALALTLSYNYYGFGFLPGVGLVLVLAAVGLFRRITNNRRLRRRRRRQRLPPVVEPLPPVPGP
ncbi:hypothetical protein RHSIM_Rhsim07G0166100 [Rhododendron simsii]|uniref:Zinc finger RING-type eukaryotic domain-containing protein n=1 Tax=Rhododendron simsii TaxID=118357 RepID=A0A834LJK7_RHOSS|nr:hypothetical protein RHSIM_Rhsim07G0166100 [Rhododendron simsii]